MDRIAVVGSDAARKMMFARAPLLLEPHARCCVTPEAITPMSRLIAARPRCGDSEVDRHSRPLIAGNESRVGSPAERGSNVSSKAGPETAGKLIMKLRHVSIW
jgi:hypothetical protein